MEWSLDIPASKVHGPTWAPPGSCRPQMGPMLAPWILPSGIPQRELSWILHNCQINKPAMFPVPIRQHQMWCLASRYGWQHGHISCHLHTQWHNGNPDSKVHGANMGPIWGWQDPGGPHVGPMNFAFWDQATSLDKFTAITIQSKFLFYCCRNWQELIPTKFWSCHNSWAVMIWILICRNLIW